MPDREWLSAAELADWLGMIRQPWRTTATAFASGACSGDLGGVAEVFDAAGTLLLSSSTHLRVTRLLSPWTRWQRSAGDRGKKQEIADG